MLLQSVFIAATSILMRLFQLLPRQTALFPKLLLQNILLQTGNSPPGKDRWPFHWKTWISLQCNCITCQLGLSSKLIKKIQNISKINRSSSMKTWPLRYAAWTAAPGRSDFSAAARVASGVHQYLMCAGRGISVESRRAVDTKTLCLRPTLNMKNWRRISLSHIKLLLPKDWIIYPFPFFFVRLVNV